MLEMQDSELDANRIATPWAERLENVLAETFRGIHHIDVDRIRKDGVSMCWEYNHGDELATYDFDLLTRFVLSCHKWCVRGSISSSGPRHIRIRLWPRENRSSGHCWDRHPTIMDAIKTFQGGESDENCRV